MSGPGWAAVPLWEWLLVLPIVFGTLYALACLAAMAKVKAQARRLARATARGAAGRAAPIGTAEPAAPAGTPESAAAAGTGPAHGGHGAPEWPPVSVLRPVYGVGKDLGINLRSVCRQDYPDYQVVFSAQREDEPALPLMLEVQREHGPARVSVVVDGSGRSPNGKVRNLLVGLSGARHDLLVVSDADVCLQPDYLRTIVAPLIDPAHPEVACATTFYRATGARRWYEALEQLFLNTEWVPNLVFASVTGAQGFVLGASNAVRHSTLDAIGGLADLGNYLTEDFEMGRRLRATGKRVVVVPYFVDMLVDLKSVAEWWRHQLYWDKNTRAGNSWGLFGTLFIRPIPFALAFAAVRLFDPLGLAVLGAGLASRLLTAALLQGWGLGDRHGLRWLALVPARDLAGFVSTALALARPTVVWTGARFVVGRGGRMIAAEEKTSA
jgi:ceramide glucosyltransferase